MKKKQFMRDLEKRLGVELDKLRAEGYLSFSDKLRGKRKC